MERNRYLDIETGITTPEGVVFRGQFYPSSVNASAILSVPFHNEEIMLPKLIGKLADQPYSGSLYFIGVNHRSTDASVAIVRNSGISFLKAEVVEESAVERSVSPPRKAGLDLSYALARQSGINIPLVTIDADAEPASVFIEEIVQKSRNYDVVIFPMRNNQVELRAFIEQQNIENQSTGVKCLLGADWFRFQLKMAMLKIGCIEPSGAGFSINSDVYKKVGGFIPAVDQEGKLVLGSNSELGTRIMLSDVRVFVSSMVCHVSPRRLIGSFTTSSTNTDGYDGMNYSDVSKPEVIVPSEKWLSYLDGQIDRGLEVILTRVPFQGKTMNLSGLFIEDPCWYVLLREVDRFYRENGYFNGKQFRLLVGRLGDSYFNLKAHIIRDFIPKNEALLSWSSRMNDLEDFRIKRLS